MLSVVTANVNGVRAAARRGGLAWLAASGADVICLQEVRATDDQLASELGAAGLGHLHVAHTEAEAKGRAGVAVLTVAPQRKVRTGVGPGPYTWWSWRGRGFDTDGGWRIDYCLATPGLAARAVKAEVGRAPSYAERWSDHAPLTVSFA